MAEADIDLTAADQARADRVAAQDRGDTAAAVRFDALERELLGGDAAEPGEVAGADDAPEGLVPLPPSEARALLSESYEGVAALERFPDFDRELPFAQGEAQAFLGAMDAPEREMLLGAFEDLNDAEKVRVIKALAGRGRLNALTPGNPASISQTPQPQERDMTDQDTFDDQIDSLREKAQEAHARGNYAKANRLAAKERDMYTARFGAGEPIGPGAPIVGRGGKSL